MPRPITLFTGQWADLPFEEVARLASEWGYDGLEIACWGDHFDPWQGAEDDAYIQGKLDLLEKYGLSVYAISNHLKGQAVCDDPIDARHEAILSATVWGDGDPEGVRQRAAEEMKMTARAAQRLGSRRSSVHWLLDLEVRRDVPAGPEEMVAAGYRDFADRWNPILDVFDECGVRFAHEVHPPRSPTTTGRRSRRWRRSGTARRSASTGTRRTSCGRTSTRSGSSGTSRTGSTMSTARTRSARRATAATAGWARTCPGRTRAAAGTSCPPATVTCPGAVLPDAQHDRLRRPDLGRVGGRRHGPPGRRPRGPRVRAAPRVRRPGRRVRRRVLDEGVGVARGRV